MVNADVDGVTGMFTKVLDDDPGPLVVGTGMDPHAVTDHEFTCCPVAFLCITDAR